ncbi:MAG: DNA methyltransferase [Candidatus Ozemobacteraceae bacterium]
MTELCDVLGAPRPEPTLPDETKNAYVFEKTVVFQNGDGTISHGRIDLYKRGCFVLEAKQGADADHQGTASDAAEYLGFPRKKIRRGTAFRESQAWDGAMLAARGQALQYARELPTEEGWPPFLVVIDVGYSFELFADFSRMGKVYLPFPDPGSFRIKLDDLTQEPLRDRLRLVWADPRSLDPTRRSARVTRELAARLAKLAISLEMSGHSAVEVSGFLMRSLFTMFAEDVDLLSRGSFQRLLESFRGKVSIFPEMVRELWEKMDVGGFSTALREKILTFNGGFFADPTTLSLTESQLELLIEAARSDWKDVEPAIFGTLLERALDPHERHSLGAHYTPRAYVERLVFPAIVEPLRAEWEDVKATAVTLAKAGKLPQAIQETQEFHKRLCSVRVLDPACGSGNFLYVTLEHLKRLEGEVIDALVGFGERQGLFEMEGATVDPHQFLGIEVNPRAAAIAEIVLWIGYLQWHFRTRGRTMPPEPVLRKFANIECRDAVLAWDRVEPLLDSDGKPVTRWDGQTVKNHAVTGEPVPDETARMAVYRYEKPRPATWPVADFVVGNPPFIGPGLMR